MVAFGFAWVAVNMLNCNNFAAQIKAEKNESIIKRLLS